MGTTDITVCAPYIQTISTDTLPYPNPITSNKYNHLSLMAHRGSTNMTNWNSKHAIRTSNFYESEERTSVFPKCKHS